MANNTTAPQPFEIKANSRRRARRWALGVGGIALLGASAALAAPLLGAKAESAPTVVKTPRRVRVAKVTAAPEQRGQRYPGTLRAHQRATLAFDLGGRLTARSVQVGDRVKKGQVLARLDARALSNAVSSTRAELDQVQARLTQQKRDQRRTERLWKSDVISAQEHESSALQVDVLAASERTMQVRLREARRMLGESVLRAPFDGIVAAVHRERGEMVAPGTSIVELSGDHRLEIEIQVPEQTLAHLSPESDVRVDLPLAGKKNLKGTVRQIGQAASGTGRLFPVIVELLDSSGLRAGMTAEAVLELSAQKALAVPVAAVRDPSGERPSVIRVRDDRAEIVPVSLGELLGDQVVVEGPLAVSDQVVIASHAFLLDGDSVQVVP